MNETVKTAFREIFPEAREVDGEMVANVKALDGGEVLSLADIASAPEIDMSISRSGEGLRISIGVQQ